MKTSRECLEILAEAYSCPDVSLTECIELIQHDAILEGMKVATLIPCDNNGNELIGKGISKLRKAIIQRIKFYK